MGLVHKIFGTHSQHELKRIAPIADKVESYREEYGKLTDEQLKANTKEFKERLAKGETLDDILPEAYATVREAGKRVLGMEHYRVQIIGGIILHQGRIAEMRTGEGKTLVCTLPAYLNALEEKGVLVVTVNDYLAKRDAEWMGQIHNFLGLSVGIVLHDMKDDERRAAYACDITYVTNNELGFDYLRDNMAIYKEQLVLRDLHYCIIDEVDSVLIDEARTPLIISGQSGKSTKLYEMCDILARQMERGTANPELSKMDAIMGVDIEEDGDFLVNEKDKIVTLTAQGIEKVEKFFHIDNYADAENLELQHNVILALRAHNLMHRDQDYVVKDDEVLIVDEFTGRIMPGRRYSDGLHQAIEAKEHVKVNRESKTLATITFQNFFNKYDKKAGMTGTALTEEKEFRDIYSMDVVEIPTNKPIARIDHEDAMFKTKKEKLHAVIEDVSKNIKRNKKSFVLLSDEERRSLVSESIHAVADNYGNTILKSTSRNEYLIKRMEDLADKTLWAIGKQLADGLFTPDTFEKGFLTRIEDLPHDVSFFMQGKIDRIDICEDDENVYVKVVDYKTGHADFDLFKTYYGLKIQLFTYMREAIAYEKKKHEGKNVIPAGLLYYNIDNPIVETKQTDDSAIEELIRKELRMKGVVNSNKNIISKLDSTEGTSLNIPVTVGKSGNIDASKSKVLTTEELLAVGRYVDKENLDKATKILDGSIHINPYEKGNENSCAYCPYNSVCGFSEDMPGVKFRRLEYMSPDDIWAQIKGNEEKQKDAGKDEVGKEE